LTQGSDQVLVGTNLEDEDDDEYEDEQSAFPKAGRV
jgi:hypothetical protein